MECFQIVCGVRLIKMTEAENKIVNPKNVMEIFRKRAKKNPNLEAAYIEEKKKYSVILRKTNVKSFTTLT